MKLLTYGKSTLIALTLLMIEGVSQPKTVKALQLHNLSKKEYTDTVRFLRSGKIDKIWIKSHSVFRPACMIDVRYFNAVFLNGNYLTRTVLRQFVPICPIECLRKSGANVCS